MPEAIRTQLPESTVSQNELQQGLFAARCERDAPEFYPRNFKIPSAKSVMGSENRDMRVWHFVM